MKKIIKHTGIVTPLNISNIDTDVIIPKQFLKKVNKNGFKNYLFYNWRFNKKNNVLNPDFILNKKEYQKSTILLVQENFGCGSSREHAVWALIDFGFCVIIAPSFGDIFFNNSFNNNLLLIKLEKKEINELFKLSDILPNMSLFIDLSKQIVLTEKNKIYKFEIDYFFKKCIMNGINHIDLTMQYSNIIYSYEKNQNKFLR